MHEYRITVEWQGNRGTGTSGYRDFDRTHEVRAEGKHVIAASADPAFRGEKDRWNPEELLVVSLAQCHMLWYLHLASRDGIVVTEYVDNAYGEMRMDAKGGGGQFTRVVLRPEVTITDPAKSERALELHEEIGEVCFIARSVNFPVEHEPKVRGKIG